MKKPSGIVLRWRLWKVCKKLGIKPYKWQKDYALGKSMYIAGGRCCGKTMATMLWATIRKVQTPDAVAYAAYKDPDTTTRKKMDCWVWQYKRLVEKTEGGKGMIYGTDIPCISESVEQQRFFQWARMQSGAMPELELLYHVPNEGKRSRATGARMKAEGLKSGVPDVCLPVARGGKHGLYIELKREKGGRLTPAQREWIKSLKEQGYAAEVCHGWEAAAKVTKEYLRGEND